MNHDHPPQKSPGLPMVSQPGPAGAVDPVCGMTVDPAHSPSHVHDGVAYHFCCPHCLAKFKENPDKYLSGERGASAPRERKQLPRGADAPRSPGAIYTCPMHPEIEQDHPGSCPKCGMG